MVKGWPREKLVRHHVPDFFREKGEVCETRTAEPEELWRLLRAKVLEETQELVEAIDAGGMAATQVLEEAVDLFEVVDTMRELLGAERFDAAKVQKANERGRFHRFVVMKLDEPIPMVLYCPKCGTLHIDQGIWATTRIHRSHLCASCGHIWRPHDKATVGVAIPSSGGVAQKPSSNVEASAGVAAPSAQETSSGVGKPKDAGSSPAPVNILDPLRPLDPAERMAVRGKLLDIVPTDTAIAVIAVMDQMLAARRSPP